MCRFVRRVIFAVAFVSLASGCAQLFEQEVTAGRWIQFDPATQRYSIDAQQVPRGELLDELKTIAQTEVRPQPERDEPVTAQAKNLDLDSLVAILLPPGTRPTIRPGKREIAAAMPEAAKPKQGEPMRPAAGTVDKPDVALDATPELKRSGTLKVAPEASYVPREVSGASTKLPAAELLRIAETMEPKKPLPERVPRATVRLQLQFEEGAPPRLIDARAIEGHAPVQRFVTGSYLYAVTAADGRVLEFGTFQDPLIEHSYLPEGQHSVGRARTGVVGISVDRDKLSGAVLRIVDIAGVPVPRELDEQTVRTALERGKTTLQLEAATISRRLEQETK